MANCSAFAVDGIALSGNTYIGGDVTHSSGPRIVRHNNHESEKEDPDKVVMPMQVLMGLLQDDTIFPLAIEKPDFKEFILSQRLVCEAIIQDKKICRNIQDLDEAENFWDQLMKALRPVPDEKPYQEPPVKLPGLQDVHRNSAKPVDDDDFMGAEFKKAFATPFFQAHNAKEIAKKAKQDAKKYNKNTQDFQRQYVPENINDYQDFSAANRQSQINQPGSVAMVNRGIAISGRSVVRGNVIGVQTTAYQYNDRR